MKERKTSQLPQRGIAEERNEESMITATYLLQEGELSSLGLHVVMPGFSILHLTALLFLLFLSCCFGLIFCFALQVFGPGLRMVGLEVAHCSRHSDPLPLGAQRDCRFFASPELAGPHPSLNLEVLPILSRGRHLDNLAVERLPCLCHMLVFQILG